MNKGQQLEYDLREPFAELALYFAGNGATNPDFIGSDGIGVEVKAPGGTFGQVQTPHNGERFTLCNSPRSPLLAREVTRSGILKTASAEYDTGITQLKLEVAPKVVRAYYREKGCSYIYFGHPRFMDGKRHKGVFRLGVSDPWNLECPMFNPAKVTLRFRYGAPKGGDRPRRSLVELNCSGISKSFVDLLDI